MGRERNYSLGDGSRGKANFNQIHHTNRNTYYGEVLQITDDGTKRIKVYIKGIDDKKEPNSIPWSFPFLPLNFSTLPRVGDVVKVILMDTKNTNSEREWLGPLTNSVQNIDDAAKFNATAGREGGVLGEVPKTPSFLNIFPKGDDVGLIGRDNSDMILRREEAIIRVNKYILNSVTKKLESNTKNPGYINIRLLKPNDLDSENNRTDTVILSDKIFLIGRESNSEIIPLEGEGYNELSKKQHKKLEYKLHPLVYGDILKEFMEIFQRWLTTHIHIGDRLGVDESGDTKIMLQWFETRLPSLLSNNIYAGGDIRTDYIDEDLLEGDDPNNLT